MNLMRINSEISDNIFYLIDDGQGRAALVDPVDADRAIAAVRARELNLEAVLNTHFHPDHVGGNQAVLKAFPEAIVVAGKGDADTIDAQFSGPDQRGVDRRVSGGDVVAIGELELTVIETPGHTPGHISFQKGRHLWSGDTLFVAGAGNCRFGGDPGLLFETFRDVLAKMPEDTVFYAGHDYAVRNAEFLLSLEPEHRETQRVLEEAKAAEAEGRGLETTLGRERKYNAFMRCGDRQLQKVLADQYGELMEEMREKSKSPAEAAFRCVRHLRDQW